MYVVWCIFQRISSRCYSTVDWQLAVPGLISQCLWVWVHVYSPKHWRWSLPEEGVSGFDKTYGTSGMHVWCSSERNHWRCVGTKLLCQDLNLFILYSILLLIAAPFEYCKLMGQTQRKIEPLKAFQGLHWQILRTTVLLLPILMTLDAVRRKTDYLKNLTGNFLITFGVCGLSYACTWPVETLKVSPVCFFPDLLRSSWFYVILSFFCRIWRNLAYHILELQLLSEWHSWMVPWDWCAACTQVTAASKEELHCCISFINYGVCNL